MRRYCEWILLYRKISDVFNIVKLDVLKIIMKIVFILAIAFFVVSCARKDVSKVRIVVDNWEGCEFKKICLPQSDYAKFSGLLFDGNLIVLVDDGSVNSVLVMQSNGDIRAIIPNAPSEDKHFYDEDQNEISWDQYLSTYPNALNDYKYLRKKYLLLDCLYPENEIPLITD